MEFDLYDNRIGKTYHYDIPIIDKIDPKYIWADFDGIFYNLKINDNSFIHYFKPTIHYYKNKFKIQLILFDIYDNGEINMYYSTENDVELTIKEKEYLLSLIDYAERYQY